MEVEQPLRIYCRDDPTLSATAREDRVILLYADHRDKSQHWIQTYDVGKLVDEQGRRAFALVNVCTGQAIVSMGDSNLVDLAPYSGHVAVELSRLWSLGKKGPDGFSSIRVLKDIAITLHAAFEGNAKRGTALGTSTGEHGDSSMWKIGPINDE